MNQDNLYFKDRCVKSSIEVKVFKFLENRYNELMRILPLFLFMLFFVFGCSSANPDQSLSELKITEINPNKWTALTKQNLHHLVQVYDLTPLLFTRNIQIQSQVIPTSHPVLTLNTRNAEHPKKLLSSFLHEQFHWWGGMNQENFKLAVKELKKIYPTAPATKGSGPDSTFVHLIICYLERQALAFYLGDKEAKEIITAIMKKDKIYPWIYYQVLNKDFAIKKVVQKYKLLPPPLN